MLGILGQLGVAPDHDCVIAADRTVQPLSVAPDPRPHLAVVEPRRHPDLELHRSAHHLDRSQQAALMLIGRPIADRHAVGDADLPRGPFKRGAQHQRVVHVAAGVFPAARTDRSDRAVPAPLPVEQPGECTARVEPGKAAPVDRGRAGDQRGRVAVADQRVVGDREICVVAGHRRLGAARDSPAGGPGRSLPVCGSGQSSWRS